MTRPLGLLALLFVSSWTTRASVPVHCRMPDVNAAVAEGTTRQFVEYCPEEAWPRGVGNTLIYFPVIFWFAVFSGRDLAITDLSSAGSVCRIFHCGFPFTSEVKEKFPGLHLRNSPRYVNYNLVQYFAGDKPIKHDIININGFSGNLFPQFVAGVRNHTDCIKKLSGCSKKDYPCMETFAYRQHFPGGFRNDSMLPTSVVGLSTSAREGLVVASPPTPSFNASTLTSISDTTDSVITHSSTSKKTYHAAIHIRAQLKSLEGNNIHSNLSSADFNLYNNTIFPKFNSLLTSRFYGVGEGESISEAGNFSSSSPPRVFVSVDDIHLKRLLITHLTSYRSPSQPLALTYVNNSAPIKHAKHMRGEGASIEKKYFPSDLEMIPTMFDWHSLSEAEYIMAYRLRGTSKLSTFLVSAAKRGAGLTTGSRAQGALLDAKNRWKDITF